MLAEKSIYNSCSFLKPVKLVVTKIWQILTYSHPISNTNTTTGPTINYMQNPKNKKQFIHLTQQDSALVRTIISKSQNTQTRLKNPHLRKNIIKAYNQTLTNSLQYLSNLSSREKLLYIFVFTKLERSPKIYISQIYSFILDKMNREMLQNIKTSGDIYFKETSFMLTLGTLFVNIWLLNETVFFYLIHSDTFNKQLSKVNDTLSNLWIYIWVRLNIKEFLLEPKKLIKLKFTTAYFKYLKEKIKDTTFSDFEMELISYLILRQGLEKAKDLPTINNYLIEATLSKKDINLILNMLNKNIKIMFLRIGTFLTTPLIENNIFQRKIMHQASCLKLNQNNTYIAGLRIGSYIPLLDPAEINHNQGYYEGNIKYYQEIKVNSIKNSEKGKGERLADVSKDNIITMNYQKIDSKFLKWYLRYISRIINRNVKPYTKENPLFNDLCAFFSIYDISLDLLVTRFSTDTEILNIIHMLVDHGIFYGDFNSKEEKDLYIKVYKAIKQSKNIKREIRKMLISYLYKITAYKSLLKNVLYDAILFSHFRYFITPSFYDYRGRSYSFGYTLNFQGLSFIKALSKLYDAKHNVNYEILYDLVENKAIRNDHIKNRMRTSLHHVIFKSKDSVKEFTNELVIRHILSYFSDSTEISKILRDFISNSFPNTRYLYHWIVRNIKKKSKALMVLSMIHEERYRRQLKTDEDTIEYSSHYCYDATSSGYQMAAMLFRERDLARSCNLIGTDNLDLYSDILQRFKYSCKTLRTCCELSIQKLDLDLMKLKNIYVSIYPQVYKFLRENTEHYKIGRIKRTTKPKLSDFYVDRDLEDTEILEKILICPLPLNNDDVAGINKVKGWLIKLYHNTRIRGMIEEVFNDYKNAFFFSISNCFKKCFTKQEFITYGKFLRYFSIMREILGYYLCNVDELLNDRKVFKQSAMTLLYGSTVIGRKKTFRKVLEEIFEKAFIKGTINELIPSYQITCIIRILEAHLQAFSNQYLKVITKLNNVGRILATYNPQIKLTTFMLITIAPLKHTDDIINLHDFTNSNKRRYQRHIQEYVYDKDGKPCPDLKKLRSTFLPNIIHAIDATIPESVKKAVFIITQECIILNIKLHTTVATIHDSFSIGRSLLVFLPYLIADQYCTISSKNLIEYIDSNKIPAESRNEITKLVNKEEDSNYLDTKDINNPYFIK